MNVRPPSQLHDTPVGQVTVFTSSTTLTKAYRLGASGLERTTAAEMHSGTFQVREFGTCNELANLLLESKTNQAISTSTPRSGALSGTITTKTNAHKYPEALTRSKADFHLGGSRCGIVILDYDPIPGASVLSREELWELLRGIIPGLVCSGVLWWCSSSSYIYNGDEELQGLRGQRLYLLVLDVGDTERFCDALAKRLWLVGRGRILVSSSGHKLVRSTFDLSMAQAAKLDFVAGAKCDPPLRQRRGEPVILSDGGFLDTLKALPNLTPTEEARYEALLGEARERAEPEASEKRCQWIEERREAGVKKLTAKGIDKEQAKDRIERALKSALGGTLLGDYPVILDEGETATVGQILGNPERYDGKQTLDPLEPEYLNRKVVGKLYLLGACPTLHSFAHGGRTYALRRQCERLYYQKGRKADLADAICAFLAEEPDIFLRGGSLVRVEDGTLIRLRKPTLQHLIGSRAAIFSKGHDGKDIPVDPPTDVVDMVLSLLESPAL